jgi:hypothetical protein
LKHPVSWSHCDIAQIILERESDFLFDAGEAETFFLFPEQDETNALVIGAMMAMFRHLFELAFCELIRWQAAREVGPINRPQPRDNSINSLQPVQRCECDSLPFTEVSEIDRFALRDPLLYSRFCHPQSCSILNQISKMGTNSMNVSPFYSLFW